MFGVSVPEILLVCVVILIVLGPDRLPGAVRTFGNLLAQFRRQAESVRRELYNSVYVPTEDFRNDFKEASKELKTVTEVLKNTPEELLTCEDKAKLEAERLKEKDEGAQTAKNQSEEKLSDE